MSTDSETQHEEILQLAAARGLLTAEEVAERGLLQQHLSRMADRGELERLSRGVYMHPAHEPTEQLEVAVVALRAPHAVLFGLSALQFHGFTTQIAHAVQIAIERDRRSPEIDWPTTEVFQVSEPAFSTGVEVHEVEGRVPVQVYSPAKTVADLFKFRNRFGLDVAIEALREGWRERLFEMEELREHAKACRVATVMRPYMEMLA